MNFRSVAEATLNIAKALAPMDTGNLRHNAISIKNFRRTRSGAKWVIHYSPRDANYLEPLITGRTNKAGKRVTPRRYFVEVASLNVGSYLKTIDFSKSTVPHNKFTKSARDRVLSTKEENDARKLLHLKSVDLYDAGKIKPNFSRKKEVIRV